MSYYCPIRGYQSKEPQIDTDERFGLICLRVPSEDTTEQGYVNESLWGAWCLRRGACEETNNQRSLFT